MSAFEIISQDQYQASHSIGVEGVGVGQAASSVDLPDYPHENKIWCDFCKGHYNEYHFGDPEREEVKS